MFIIKLDGGKTMEVDEKTFWHTTSHVMAQAIKRLYKNVKLAIGPAIDNGFYYDIDSEKPFTTEDLVKIEEEMMKIVKEGYSLEYREMDRKEAIKYYEDLGEIYKVEILKDLGDDVEKVSFYKQGEFEDLCKGPHIPSIKPIKAIKLLSVSGAYWRGNEKNKMLQRIYGVSFPKKSMLDEYLEKLKEAKERDHRKIGKEQELFMTHELVGSGLPIFLPNGAVIKRILERYIVDKEIEQGYNHVYSPSLANTELERVRQMCQNDAHIFVTRNQIKSVVSDVMSLILDVYKDFRISEYKIRLSLRDKENKEKYYDDDEMWEKAESELREIVKESGFEYYEAEGEAAFYGPKLDVQIKTALRT